MNTPNVTKPMPAYVAKLKLRTIAKKLLAATEKKDGRIDFYQVMIASLALSTYLTKAMGTGIDYSKEGGER